ncbi:MAG: endonuclease III [Planctomycetota bacterium]
MMKKKTVMPESPDARSKRVKRIIAALKKLYPAADCALEHKSAMELLISTILSAQCTDVRVNMVAPTVFKRYPKPTNLANAKQPELEGLIRSTGFFRNKAKNIIGAARTVVDRFNGKVPDTMGDLLELPGVARKTANVVLGTWFKKNEGVVVDTHIGRLAHRLHLTWRSKDDKDAVKIEQDLMEILPREEWTYVGHALIWHGRKICGARKPLCDQCTLAADCPSAFTPGEPPKGKAGTASDKPARQSPKHKAR